MTILGLLTIGIIIGIAIGTALLMVLGLCMAAGDADRHAQTIIQRERVSRQLHRTPAK